jgi:hypothetical protein
MAFTLVENILGSECIGTTRPKIVGNFVNLETAVLSLSSEAESADRYFNGSNQSLTTPGYQILPGGLIFEWGKVVSLSGGDSVVVTLPHTLPNNLFGVITTPITPTNSTDPIVAGWQIINLSSFTLRNISSYTSDISWFAFGY